MALLQNVIQRGTHAARPAAGSQGVIYFESDTGQLFRDSGSAWQLVDLSALFATKGDLLVGTGSGTVAKLAAGTDTYVLTADSSQTDGIKWAAAAAGASGLFTAYLCYQDQQTQNTAGAVISSGSWVTVRLTTEVADTGTNGSLSSNQITLAAGTYRVLASAPFWTTNRAQARLRDVTNSVTLLTGSLGYASSEAKSLIQGSFTLAGSTVVELQAQVQTTGNIGLAGNFGPEVYAQVELFKE